MYRYVAAIAAFFVLMGLAYYEGTQHAAKPAITVQHHTEDVKTQNTQKILTQTITKDITKKDGSKEHIVVKNDEHVQVLKKDDDKQDVTVVQQPTRTKYSLGIEYLPSLVEPPSYRDLEVNAGARLGDLNLWLTGGFDVKDTQFKIGLRYEF